MAVPSVMVHGVERHATRLSWIIFGGRMMYHGTLNRPVWSSSFPRGQFGPGLSDSLTADHSGISTDVLLFSDINLSLTHHSRVHKRGLPHIAFRKNYLTRQRGLMSQVAVPVSG